MKNLLYKFLFGLIILIAILFRFYNLGSMPPQPTVDEVSIGYNAYSILKTGVDEYGTKFPILLRAYDDWRPALYVYLVIPFVQMFGLTVEAVRLPSVILSVLTVIAVFFLVTELARDAKKIRIGSLDIDIPLIATALFAISPWDIYISRFGHEVNASFSFLIFGILFFLMFVNRVKEKGVPWSLYLSAVFFALSFDSYQSTKIVTPSILLVLAVLYLKKLLLNKKSLIVSILIGFLVALPILATTLDPNTFIRFSGTSLLSTSTEYFDTVDQRMVLHRSGGDFLGKALDNKEVSGGLLISRAYLSHLDPVWVFLNGGGEQFKAPTLGLLYLFELPLIFMGFLFLTRIGISSKNIVFIIFWAIIAILPGAITNGYAHPMRVFSILPVPQIIAAIGFITIADFFSSRRGKIAFLSVSALLYMGCAVWFAHSYFVLAPRELSKHFQYGVINALKYAGSIQGDFDRVVVSNSDRLFESYMFYLFLNKIDPVLYQKSGGTGSGGFAEEHHIGKYSFVNPHDKLYSRSLYVINPSEFMRGTMKEVKFINYLDGKRALVLGKTK